MALNKWQLNERMATQINRQNDNIDIIDKFISGGGWKPIRLSSNWDNFDTANPPMFQEYPDRIVLKGRIKPINNEAFIIHSEIGYMDLNIGGTREYAVTTGDITSPIAAIYTTFDGKIKLRTTSTNTQMLSLEGITINR